MRLNSTRLADGEPRSRIHTNAMGTDGISTDGKDTTFSRAVTASPDPGLQPLMACPACAGTTSSAAA
jgi:hypothetical protein